MTTKKQLLKEIAALKNKVETTNTDFATLQDYNRKLQGDVAKIRASVLTGDSSSDTMLQELQQTSIYNQIMNNEIPSQYTWQYWVHINQLAQYWVNRWTEFETEEHDKEQIILAMWCACMYGKSCYSKSKKLAYTINKVEEGFVYGSLVTDMSNDSQYYQYNDKQWKANDEGKEKLSREDVVIFDWQFGNVGIFVWYMIPVLQYLYVTSMVPSNACMLLNKLYFEVNDLTKFKNEVKWATDPTVQVVPLLADSTVSGSNVLNSSNRILENKFNQGANIEQLITASKFLQETYCNKFGVMISSAKNQSLSADANLSASTSALLANEHDRRMKRALKELGIELEINEPDVIEPENENADKDGLGTAKTDGENIENKGE